MLAEGVKSFSSDTYQKFMQGAFPLMLFALPAACLAMYHEAYTKNKKIAAGILFSAALTCFLTGITEPVEFTFIFVAPILYVFNAIMAGLSYMVMYLLHAHIAKSFSAGLIDYISFGGTAIIQWLPDSLSERDYCRCANGINLLFYFPVCDPPF